MIIIVIIIIIIIITIITIIIIIIVMIIIIINIILCRCGLVMKTTAVTSPGRNATLSANRFWHTKVSSDTSLYCIM